MSDIVDVFDFKKMELRLLYQYWSFYLELKTGRQNLFLI
jgi:hypothetical protein